MRLSPDLHCEPAFFGHAGWLFLDYQVRCDDWVTYQPSSELCPAAGVVGSIFLPWDVNVETFSSRNDDLPCFAFDTQVAFHSIPREFRVHRSGWIFSKNIHFVFDQYICSLEVARPLRHVERLGGVGFLRLPLLLGAHHYGVNSIILGGVFTRLLICMNSAEPSISVHSDVFVSRILVELHLISAGTLH